MAIDPESLKAFFDVIDVGVAIMYRPDPADNESIRLVYVNDAGARTADIPPEEYVGERLLDAFPGVEQAGLLDIYGDTLDSGEVKDLGEVIYADGRIDETLYRIKVVRITDDTLAVFYSDVTEAKRIEMLIAEQNRVIREMSTPTIELWKEIVLLPLVGNLDTVRAMQMIERLLDAIVAHEARVAIFDITGVPTIDTQAAQCLLQAVSAARMLGAQVFLTGIKPETAMTLTKLGVDTGELRTHHSLHQGVLAAYRTLGYELVRAGQ